MMRHPIYILLCLFAVGYLALADARGWSAWQSLTNNLARATGRSSAFRSLNHK